MLVGLFFLLSSNCFAIVNYVEVIILPDFLLSKVETPGKVINLVRRKEFFGEKRLFVWSLFLAFSRNLSTASF